ncbi:phage/plasmid replication protein, II/X family [Paenibacillus mucilaginosus]|uniref:phage/plasmid replication protein, II/X family n=1 Tax=Paenibacillus mucilaginosus TaxID=61624 RepID=UPI001EEF9CFB|nr:phage/plasmid replication protein, II/X family [Paenibacillus mucilaginosus]
MAIDTVRLRSPYITEEAAQLIESQSILRQGIDMSTGERIYSITTGDLDGSYDNRISIQVKRDEFVSVKGKQSGANTRIRGTAIKMPCKPYVEVEASVHKLFLGHNLWGGTDEFRLCCAHLIDTVEQSLGVELPIVDVWLVLRVDIAYIFRLMSGEAIEEFFYRMKNGYYPRRDVRHDGLHGLFSVSTTTMFKMYHKGPEFKKHDFPKLRKKEIFQTDELWDMLTTANDLLRVEVGIKGKKLKYDFNKTHRYEHEPYVIDVTAEYLQSVYDKEVYKIMSEGKKNDDKIVRDKDEVHRRLHEYYKPRLAKTLFGAWLQMTTYGLEQYKEYASKSTYYRQKEQLEIAGVSFQLSNDTYELNGARKELLPQDFSPFRDNKYRLPDLQGPAGTYELELAHEKFAGKLRAINIKKEHSQQRNAQ